MASRAKLESLEWSDLQAWIFDAPHIQVDRRIQVPDENSWALLCGSVRDELVPVRTVCQAGAPERS